MENWPGGLPEATNVHVGGSDDRWVMTPLFTMQRIEGGGDTWWADGTGRYPDGSTWYAVALLHLRDGLIQRETWFFGPTLEAPEWRSKWVERT